MTRVVFSIYISLREAEIATDLERYRWDNSGMSKSMRTAIEFSKNFSRLRDRQRHFASSCNAEYILFGRDQRFEEFCDDLDGAEALTTYQLINFYKIYMLEQLAESFDEVLYLDFDVIPLKFANIFEVFDFSQGVCVRSQTPTDRRRTPTSERDPASKFRCTSTLFENQGIAATPEVINTGVIGIHRSHATDLNFFGFDFPLLCDLSHRNGFSINNESLFSYRVGERRMDVQWLPDKWHHIYDSSSVGKLNRNVHLIHVINKRFDDVWRE
jgi:hypothetical protein